MEDVINSINLAIERKRTELLRKVECGFSEMNVIPLSTICSSDTKDKKTPPISFILYGVGGAFLVGFLCAKAVGVKILLICISIASIFGGKKISSNINSTPSQASKTSNIANMKNEVATKVIGIVKSTRSDWEQYMEANQSRIQLAIQKSSFSEDEKSTLLSKIYLYENFDIRLSDYNNRIKNINETAQLQSEIDLYKKTIIDSINTTVQNQILKYKSLLG